MRGKKTGGRRPGTPNKFNQEVRERALAKGISPLEYMLNVMRDSKASVDRRDEMARAAAPYVHARLASVEVSGNPTGEPIRFLMVGRLPEGANHD